MDTLGTLPSGLSWLGLGAAATIFALTWFLLTSILGDTAELGVNYTVSIPEQCKPGWRGEELEEVQLNVLALPRS